MENKQISSENITLYRAIAMTMVVLYHCTCYYAHPTWPFGEGPYVPLMKLATTLMGGIHMPVFVFISGYLFWYFKKHGRYNDLGKFYKGKILRLLVPYLFVGGGMVLIFNGIYNYKILLYGIAHLWFLLMLFGQFIIAPVAWWLFEKIQNDRAVTSAVLSTFLLYPLFSDITLFQITKVFYFLPYFSLGYLLIRRGSSTLYRDWFFWLALIATAAILFIFTPSSLFIDKISREYASMIVIIALTLIPNISITKGRKIIDFISANSMGIYLFHQIIVALFYMNPITKTMLDTYNPYVSVCILFIVVFGLSLLTSVIFNKFRFTRFLIGSKI